MGPPRDRGKICSNDSGQLSFFILILPASRGGAFSGDFTTNLARQCRAFSRALKIEKLKAPLFRGPEGAGATNDWCITAHAADHHLCFRLIDSTTPLLPKSEISSPKTSSMAVQPGLSGTWSATMKTGFLTTWPIYRYSLVRHLCLYLSI